METRTNHFLVGAFVLLLVAGLGAFIIWAVKADVDAEHTNYHVYFAGSVSGLSKVSEVRYRGVPIGTVTDIRIDPDNVERVRVTLDVSGDTVIKEDSIASIEMQGITGVAIVQISGGRQSSPALEARPGEVYPVIQSKRSSLEKLFSDTPELINRILTLVETVTRIFDDKNIAAIGGMLEPLGPRESGGLHIRLNPRGKGGCVIRAGILPGVLAKIVVERVVRLEDAETVSLPKRTGALVLDGEREILMRREESWQVRLDREGPWIIDVEKTLREAVARNWLNGMDPDSPFGS